MCSVGLISLSSCVIHVPPAAGARFAQPFIIDKFAQQGTLNLNHLDNIGLARSRRRRWAASSRRRHGRKLVLELLVCRGVRVTDYFD